MVCIGMVVLGAVDVGRAVGFWSRALGYELREGGAGADWSSLTPAGGLGTGLGLQLSTTTAEKHPRVHLDLYAADAAEQAAEIERLVSLGAERVALVGGVGAAMRPYLEPDIAARLKAPLYDATDGAVLFVGGVIAAQREAAQ